MSQAGLSLHPEKTRGSPVPRPPLFPSAASVVDMTAPTSHFDFLGYRFWRSRKEELGVRRLISPKSEGKLRAKLKPLTRRANGASMEAIVAKLRPVLRGWDGYFKHASAEVLREIDGWVRGRLRAIPSAALRAGSAQTAQGTRARPRPGPSTLAQAVL